MSHKCSICEKNFKSISASIQHRLAAHAPPSFLHPPPLISIPPKPFFSRGGVRFAFQMGSCDRGADCRFSHDESRAHASSTCKLCNKCFKNTTSLAQHTQMAHAKPKPIEEEDGYDWCKRDREDMEDARAIYEEWYNPDGGNEDYAGGDD